MKTLYAVLVFTVLMLAGCEPEFDIATSEVPEEVLQAFQSRYPNATDISWKAEKEKGHFYFEAAFLLGKQKKEVHYATDGTFVNEEK